MARTVSATALSAMLSQQTEQVFLTCVTISHPDLNEDLRFVDDNTPLQRNKGLYLPAAFQFRLPSDQEDNVPRGQIVMDNIDRQIIAAVRPLREAPEISIEIVLKSTPNNTELGPISFKLREFSYDAETIVGEVSPDEDFLNDAFPRRSFTPRTARGLF